MPETERLAATHGAHGGTQGDGIRINAGGGDAGRVRGMDGMAVRANGINRKLAARRVAEGRGPGRVSPVYTPDPGTWMKRREILGAAARLADEEGIWRLSVRAVAKSMHLVGPTLSYYFPNREAMVAEIVTEHLYTLTQRVGDAIDGAAEGGPAAELEAFATAFLTLALTERHEHRLMIRSGDVLPARDRRGVGLRWAILRELVEERLVGAVPALADRSEAARALAMGLLSALSGAALWDQPGGETAVRDLAAVLVGAALAGAAGQLAAV